MIRCLAANTDRDAIWTILEPVIRGGETYTWDAALNYWMAANHEIFVAENAGQIAGTNFICANRQGGGSRHV